MRDLPASVALGVQKLAVGKQSAAAVAVAAAVVGDHCSPSGLLYALEDANTCTFLYDNVPKSSNKIVCELFIIVCKEDKILSIYLPKGAFL